MNSDKSLDPAHALRGQDMSVNPNAIESHKPEDVIKTDLACSTGLDVVYKFLYAYKNPEQASVHDRISLAKKFYRACRRRRYLLEFLEESPTDIRELASYYPERVVPFYRALVNRLDHERKADPWLGCLAKLHRIFFELNL